MDISQLEATGLSNKEATAYALLLEKGSVAPPDAAKELQTSRTNAYKLFDKLVENGLAQKDDSKKKIVYRVNHPSSLVSYVYGQRAEVQTKEDAVKSLMDSLLDRYREHADSSPFIETSHGRQEVIDAFKKQIALGEEIYFIHSKSDIPTMGYDTMHDIRTEPGENNIKRHGILTEPYKDSSPINYQRYERGLLSVTWLEKGLYSAPVEWSVAKSSLLIISYTEEAHAVYISDPLIAEAFLQMWNILNTLLEEQPTNKKHQQKDQ